MATYPLPSDQLWHSLKEGSEFFQHEGDIFETLRRLVDELDENGLDYALIGGLALVAHGYRRFTEDVDTSPLRFELPTSPHRLLRLRPRQHHSKQRRDAL